MEKPIATYREEFPGTWRRFRLYPDRLEIEGVVNFHRVVSAAIRLLFLSPAYRVVRMHCKRFQQACTVFMACAVGFVVAMYLAPPRREAWATAFGTCAAMNFAYALWRSPKLKVFQFDGIHTGRLMVDVVYFHAADREACEAFVETLAQLLKKAGGPGERQDNLADRLQVSS